MTGQTDSSGSTVKFYEYYVEDKALPVTTLCTSNKL